MATMQINVAEERADPFFLMQNIKKGTVLQKHYNITDLFPEKWLYFLFSP